MKLTASVVAGVMAIGVELTVALGLLTDVATSVAEVPGVAAGGAV